MINSIYLRRAGKVIMDQEPSTDVVSKAWLATAMNNIEALGYRLTSRLTRALSQLSKRDFEEFYKWILADLKTMVGAHVPYRPMYPGFPDQVMQESDADLYLNAIYHYYTLLLPINEGESRTMPLNGEAQRFKIIDLGSRAEFNVLIRQLMEAKGSISEADKEDIDHAIRYAEIEEITELLPPEIPFKENAAFVAGLLWKHGKADASVIGQFMKTATDVLRLAVAWSGGDTSLAEACRFRKFTRPERKLLLSLLEQCDPMTEDMLRYKPRWIRLGEILHPSEYKHRFPRSREAFDILRNNKPFVTYNSSVELAFQSNQIWMLIELLMLRPGEFARRLDQLTRSTEHAEYVVLAFEEVVHDVSTPVLLQVKSHFAHRKEPMKLRTFFPKGNVAKAYAIPHSLPEIAAEICGSIVEVCERELLRRFSMLPPLGKTFVDPRLKEYLVPFSERSASKALRTIVRGSRVPMPEGDTIRFFNWWKEGNVNGQPTGRVDIDLSAVLYDRNWQYIEHISYTNLRSSKYLAVHSGDIVSAPHGACEFIDLHIPSIVEYGGRYVVASLQSFTEQPYRDLPECFAGWMMRRKPGSGEVFEPTAVVDKIDLTADTQIAIPVIMDLVKRTVIWTDLALTRHPDYYNNVEGNRRGMSLMGHAMTELRKPDLFDLFQIHAKARGELVETAEQAETIFASDRGVTPFDIERIMAEYLA
ncbi:TerD family protein [Paenibacillus soyae]|uniref:TerD family protein n=1 Tax=Paenibacillus soyae TaxID=2969249 RepID=A0A9X2MPU5_9BACL|nr:TerD family protein [Paenibacillus soyae]MCR2804626.1 TerD family protein [Paenibacillus soyae]